MHRIPITVEELVVNPYQFWDKQGILLTSGDLAAGHFNTMTVGWGSLGVMWGFPFVQVAVRPNRYTFKFMEQYGTFTLCAFPDAYHAALQLLGTKSGRDGDKISESGLTLTQSTRVAAPCFAEANLVLECRKIYWDDLAGGHFLEPKIENRYPQKDYHRIYFGELLAVLADETHKA